MASIDRSSGDETDVKVTWNGDVDFRTVTAISMAVYTSADKTGLVETLTGEVQGFDPATYFPIIDANWTGTRYFHITITRGAEDQPLPDVGTWTQT